MQFVYRFLIALGLISVLAAVQAQGDVNAGKAKSTACAVCHGVNGNSEVNPSWPKIAQQPLQYLSKELLDFKAGPKDGRNNPVMSALAATLSDADIADLAAYYHSLPRTVGAAQPNLVAPGQLLYRGGNLKKGIPACSACHSPEGLGNAPAAFPLLSGQNAAYVAIELKAFRSGTRTNDPNHMMRDIAAKLSDDDIAAVASYVSGLH